MSWQTVEIGSEVDGLEIFGFEGPEGRLELPVMVKLIDEEQNRIGILDIDNNSMFSLSHYDEDDEECLRGIVSKACELLNFSEQAAGFSMPPNDAAMLLQSTISSILLGQLKGV